MLLTKLLRSSHLYNLVHFQNPVINRPIYLSTPSIHTNHVNSTLKTEPNPKLSQLFSDKTKTRSSRQIKRDQQKAVYKDISPSMIEFSRYLYNKGYFESDLRVFSNNVFDEACLRNLYGHNFLRHAAEKFGFDNQEIAKWLSGSDLKKVALFGCPSLTKKTVFSAKTLRTFFKIQENTVCSKCVMNQSCRYANKNVWNSNTKNLHLPAVMNVISHYALESVHPQLIVPDEIKTIVTRLLKVVVKLSQPVL